MICVCVFISQDTSLPVCVFIWDIENNNHEEVEVSIMFTFQNSDGTPNEVSAGHFNESFTCKVGAHSATDNHVHEKRNSKNIGSSSEVTGVLLHHKHPTQPYTFGIAAKSIHQVQNFTCSALDEFDTHSISWVSIM